jgi:two-component system, LytTR family, response regulator AlgR
MMDALRLMLVDDEAPARARLRDLLADIAATVPTEIVAEASNGIDALSQIEEGTIEGKLVDVVLLDIRMPRMDGTQLALHLSRIENPPAIIFTTAYDQYAVKAFELSAVDYLVKPVRAERLAEALLKAAQKTSRAPSAEALHLLAPEGRQQLRSSERGRVLLIPIDDVLYLKAEMKYVTARTRSGEHLLEDSLAQLESEFGHRFVRVHRNCLVARKAISGCERGADADGEPSWNVLLTGIDEVIAVSRRQWPHVKELIKGVR